MLIKILLAGLLLSFSSFSHAEPPEVSADVASKYPGPWRTDFNMKLTQALSKAGARGCGIIIYRVSKSSDSEYLAACSTDNNNWKAYMVWPNIGEVMGPYSL